MRHHGGGGMQHRQQQAAPNVTEQDFMTQEELRRPDMKSEHEESAFFDVLFSVLFSGKKATIKINVGRTMAFCFIMSPAC